MEHVAALLLMVGCSSDLSECRELPAPIALYEAYEDCESDRPAALAGVRGQSDHIMANCVEIDPALDSEDAELVWDVDPDGVLVATLEPYAVVIASAPRDGPQLRQE